MVNEYKQSCGYSIGTLKDFVYLIPYSADRFSYSIDSGDCSEVSMNDSVGIIRIEGFQTTLKNTETLDGRFKYESEVGIYINETLGKNLYDRLRYLIQNRWFVVVEDIKGIQYIQSVEFFSEFEYNISLTDQTSGQNRIQLRFKGSSNFPSMIMGSNITKSLTTPIITNDCRYIKGGVYDFKMCDSGYVVIKENNHEIQKIETNGGHNFKGIDFTPKSFTYAQSYADGQFEDTITFSIPLSDYKYFWHYNLIEFKNNRYVATFRTANDNLYVIGYSHGASCSYVIETSTAVNALNKITITLKYIGSEGLYISSSDDTIFDVDTSVILRPAADIVSGEYTKVCRGDGTAYITLIQKYTASGTPINEYLALEGYADRYPNINIVGVYSLDDDMGFPLIVSYSKCSGGMCNTSNTISNPYNMSSFNSSYTFVFSSNCTYTMTEPPYWLDVSDNGTSIEMKLNSNVPSVSTSYTFYIQTSDGSRYPIIVNYTTSSDVTGWDIMPRQMTITNSEQNITVSYIGNVTANDLEFSSDTLTLVSINGGNIIVRVPKNITDRDVYHFFKIRNKKNGEEVEVKITQSSANEDWRSVSGYYCENGNKYSRLELYINGKPAGIYKAGTLIEEHSSECQTTKRRWVRYDTVCNGVDEYELTKEQISNDGGNTWTDTGNTMVGSLVESDSEKCDPEHVQWRNTGTKICEMGKKCEVWEKYYDGVSIGQTETRNCVVDESVCPVSYPTKWVLSSQSQCKDRGNGICDSWFLEEEFISYDGGTTWESLGLFRISDEMKQKDDYDCNCQSHDLWRYERWVWDGKGFLCDDESYNCKMSVMWIPYGFVYNKRYPQSRTGEWTDKTITEIVAICDFEDLLDNMIGFAKNCMQLEKCDDLDCTNIYSIYEAFYNCVSLENMPLTNMRNVKDTRRAFYGCSKMNGIINMPIDNLDSMDMMFYGCGIEQWNFGDCKLTYAPEEPITNSTIKRIYGLDYSRIITDEVVYKYEYPRSVWRSNTIEVLEIKNVGINFGFQHMPNLNRDSINYIYNNAKSDVEMTWSYNDANLNKWGSLPTGKSNIKFKKV